MDPRCRDAIEILVRDRRMLVVADVLAAVTPALPVFEELGAEVRVIAAVTGVGDLPSIEYRLLGGTRGSIMEGIRGFERAMRSPPVEVIDWLDTWDPDRSALVFSSVVGDVGSVAGRRIYGARRPEWVALEDKTVIDDVWDAAGVRRAPREVVPVAEAVRVHRFFGDESVWVADNRDGWHGGADRVRWIADEHQLAEARTFFAGVADRVRVMPFLEGIPCSIHGYVLPQRVQVFRPVEMLILRDRRRGRFVYASVATTWDPHPDDRDEMRSAARRVGEHLRVSLAYVGGFSIDGVMTAEGFLPTELNPRLSAGLGVQWQSVGDGYPAGTLTRMLIEGDLDPTILDGLEERIVPAADANRIARVVMSTPEDIGEEEVTMRLETGDGSRSDGGETALIKVGRGPSGSTVMAMFKGLAPGDSFAPRALEVAHFAASRWGLDLGDLEAAPDVRTRGRGDGWRPDADPFFVTPPE